MYIDGEWRDATGGETIPRGESGETGSIYGSTGGNEDDVDAAHDRAPRPPSPTGRRPAGGARNEIVQNLLDELNAHFRGDCRPACDGGRHPGLPPVGEFATATGDVEMALELSRQRRRFGRPRRSRTRTITSSTNRSGVVGIISPWNFHTSRFAPRTRDRAG